MPFRAVLYCMSINRTPLFQLRQSLVFQGGNSSRPKVLTKEKSLDPKAFQVAGAYIQKLSVDSKAEDGYPTVLEESSGSQFE